MPQTKHRSGALWAAQGWVEGGSSQEKGGYSANILQSDLLKKSNKQVIRKMSSEKFCLGSSRVLQLRHSELSRTEGERWVVNFCLAWSTVEISKTKICPGGVKVGFFSYLANGIHALHTFRCIFLWVTGGPDCQKKALACLSGRRIKAADPKLNVD